MGDKNLFLNYEQIPVVPTVCFPVDKQLIYICTCISITVHIISIVLCVLHLLKWIYTCKVRKWGEGVKIRMAVTVTKNVHQRKACN